MERVAAVGVLVGYAAAAIALLVPGLAPAVLVARARPIAGTAAAVHAVWLLGVLVDPRQPAGTREALSATGLAVAAAWAWGVGPRLASLGMFLVPVAAVFTALSWIVPSGSVRAVEETGYSAWLPVHLGLVFAGLGGFALSTVLGALYLWSRGRLKRKDFAGMGRLPSLDQLDRLMFRAMLFGFVALTLGIAAGGAWAAAALDHRHWAGDPKIWFTAVVWAWYALALQVRLVWGRRGRWTAWFSIVGFCGMLFSLLGLNQVLEGFHAYGG
jgi:ABC-type transport system involved in cytochrome c biogenesis permease subunit